MAFDDKLLERKLLLKRAFPGIELFDIGKELNIPYFAFFTDGWEVDEDEASFKIASNINDKHLEKIFDKHAPREWAVFRGAHYTFENGKLRLEGSGKTIQTNVYQAKKKYGENCVAILKKLVRAGGGCNLGEIKKSLKQDVDPLPILVGLEQLKVIVTSYKGGQYQEWEIPEEISPMVQMELGIVVRELPKMAVAPTVGVEEADFMLEERQRIRGMDKELDEYLNVLLSCQVWKEFLRNCFSEIPSRSLWTPIVLRQFAQYHSTVRTG
jgi:hypothetical protein